jgi:hypothetical protein
VENPYSRDIDARTILNNILIMSPPALVRLTVICDSLSTFCVTESHLARVLSRGKVFSHVNRVRCFSQVSDYQAWPGRSKEELLSCQRDREIAQLLFCLIWKLNLSVGATLRLSGSGANTNSQSVDADFGIGIAIAPSGRVLFISC